MLVFVLFTLWSQSTQSFEQHSREAFSTDEINKDDFFDFTDLNMNSFHVKNEKQNSKNNNSLFDLNTVHELVEKEKRNFKIDYRRQYPATWEVEKEAYRWNPFFVSKAFEMMKQSIYATRFRLEATKPLRKTYLNDFSYNIGTCYGVLTQLIFKMDNMYAQMLHFGERTFFLYYLIIYEKILAAHVDATFLVERMFAFHKQYRDIMKPEQESYQNDGIPPNPNP